MLNNNVARVDGHRGNAIVHFPDDKKKAIVLDKLLGVIVGEAHADAECCRDLRHRDTVLVGLGHLDHARLDLLSLRLDVRPIRSLETLGLRSLDGLESCKCCTKVDDAFVDVLHADTYCNPGAADKLSESVTRPGNRGVRL